MNINETLYTLRMELIHLYPNTGEIIRVRKETKTALLTKIELVILQIIETIAKNQKPYFESINIAKFGTNYHSGRLQMEESGQYKKKISFERSNSRSGFAIIVFLLSKIHKLLLTSKTSTKRELFYGNLELFKSQVELDIGMRDVCCILNAPPWELGVLSTAKGLVAGPLIFKSNDDIITCDKPGGVLIPQNILEVELISTTIQWALIVEKDAAFHKILDANGLSKLRECLFITGKGFPDINTRLLVCRIWEYFRVPILALVDADPYGLEIMCVYRFGSVNSSLFADQLACPSVRWLGVHPSDIKILAVESDSLSAGDVRRISKMANRPYIKENEKIRDEVQILLDGNVKAEIEGITNISSNYITDVYIPSKIHCKEFF